MKQQVNVVFQETNGSSSEPKDLGEHLISRVPFINELVYIRIGGRNLPYEVTDVAHMTVPFSSEAWVSEASAVNAIVHVRRLFK